MRSLIVFSLIVGTTSVSAAQEPVPASVADGSAPTILFVGTSLTAGYGLKPGQAFPARIQEKLDSLDLDYRVVNAGVAGEASAAARARVSSLLDEPFDVLVLETGAQDMLRRTAPDTIRANIAAIIAQVGEARPHARIVLLGMMAPPFFDREYAEQFGALYTDLAREHELPIVPFLLLGVGGVPSLNLADGFHPNAEGHRVLARNVWEVLAPVLGAAVADSAAGPAVAGQLVRQGPTSGRSAAGRRLLPWLNPEVWLAPSPRPGRAGPWTAPGYGWRARTMR